MPFEIIDFHTHPFTDDAHNICDHRRYCDMSIDNTRTLMEGLGVSRICGSVIDGQKTGWERIKENNDLALQLRRRAALPLAGGGRAPQDGGQLSLHG